MKFRIETLNFVRSEIIFKNVAWNVMGKLTAQMALTSWNRNVTLLIVI